MLALCRFEKVMIQTKHNGSIGLNLFLCGDVNFLIFYNFMLIVSIFLCLDLNIFFLFRMVLCNHGEMIDAISSLFDLLNERSASLSSIFVSKLASHTHLLTTKCSDLV